MSYPQKPSPPKTPDSAKRKPAAGTDNFPKRPSLRSDPKGFQSPRKIREKHGCSADELIPLPDSAVNIYVAIVAFKEQRVSHAPNWQNQQAQIILNMMHERATRMVEPSNTLLQQRQKFIQPDWVPLSIPQHISKLLAEVMNYCAANAYLVPDDFYNIMHEIAIIAATHVTELTPRIELIKFLLINLNNYLKKSSQSSTPAFGQLAAYVETTIAQIYVATINIFLIYDAVNSLLELVQAQIASGSFERSIDIPTNFYAVIVGCLAIFYDSFSLSAIQPMVGNWTIDFVHKKQPRLLTPAWLTTDLPADFQSVVRTTGRQLSEPDRLKHLYKHLGVASAYSKISTEKILDDWRRNTIYLRYQGVFVAFDNSSSVKQASMDINTIYEAFRTLAGVNDKHYAHYLAQLAHQDGIGSFHKLFAEHLDYVSQYYGAVDQDCRYYYIDNSGTNVDMYCIMFIKKMAGKKSIIFSPRIPIVFHVRVKWVTIKTGIFSSGTSSPEIISINAYIMADHVFDENCQLCPDELAHLKRAWPEIPR